MATPSVKVDHDIGKMSKMDNFLPAAPDFPYFGSWRRTAQGEVRQCFPCGRWRYFPYADQITESMIWTR
jgi:hypothetical protein